MRNGGDTPGDIIADILLRLPSKAVLRFKLVSKTWYALISDPVFINLHSKRVCPNPKILFSTTVDSNNSIRSELRLLDYESPSFKTSGLLTFPLEKSPAQPFKIIGSDFGLVCIATDYCGSFYLWNPTTRESRTIPNLGFTGIDHYDYLHGLGYDSVSNDFKVVISLYPVEYSKTPMIAFHVFSLKQHSWKTITSPFQYYYSPSRYPTAWQYSTDVAKEQAVDSAETTLATVMKGVFHWIVRVPNENDPHIIAFDSAKETFHKLPIPEKKFETLQKRPDHENAGGILSLMEHRGCLCLVCSEEGTSDVKEIWMMKEYGVHKSWIHFVSFYKTGSDVPSRCIYKPLCVTSKNELVFYTSSHLARWSGGTPAGYARQDTGKIRIKRGRILGAALVDETLISPIDITHKGILSSMSNCFAPLLDIFRFAINCFTIS